jgi:ElaB/YqjD/DUF883 family membrane-anchored ribosome-binding protein
MEPSEMKAIRESMEKNLQGFMSDAKSLIKVVCGEPEEKGCKEWAQDQIETLRKHYQDFGERVRPGVDRTQTMVKEHPYWTAGALAGAGLAAVSFLIVTRKKD